MPETPILDTAVYIILAAVNRAEPPPCAHTTGPPASRNLENGTRHSCGWCGGTRCKTCCWWDVFGTEWRIIGAAYGADLRRGRTRPFSPPGRGMRRRG